MLWFSLLIDRSHRFVEVWPRGKKRKVRVSVFFRKTLFFSLLKTKPKKEMIRFFNKEFKAFKVCVNCKHFKQVDSKAPQEFLHQTCTLFGTLDLVTGKVSYSTAFNARDDQDRCGEQGRFYDRAENVEC